MTRIILLDGGLGQEINKRSSRDKAHPLWSVKVMEEEPEVIVAVHTDFIDAGARTLSTNNYTASITRLKRHGVLDQFQHIHNQAIDLLEQAIAKADVARNDVTIAGCLMPLAASYVAKAAHDYDQSYDEYCKIIEAQLSGVDVFLVETISNITEARAAIDALKAYDQKTHIGLTMSDDMSNTLRSGERLDEAVDQLTTAGADALMVNCSFPEVVDKAIPSLAKSGLPFGGYANGFTSIESLAPGTTVDSLSARTDLTPESYSGHVMRWIDGGATIVGGCCEISPQHIRKISERLANLGYKITKFG